MTRKINLIEYEEAARHWQATHPSATHDLIHRKALAHLNWKHRNLKPMDKAKRVDWRLLIILALLLLLGLLLIPHAHAQFSKINSIEYQQNGSTVAFITYPHKLNFSGCTVSFSGSVGSINCTGGGGVSLTPSVSQIIIQPTGTQFDSNVYGYKREAINYDWKQFPSGSISVGSNTVTLIPCPLGFLATINGTNSNHWIYLDSAPGDVQQLGEPVKITAESCAGGSASGTITFSAAYVHANGYALESGTGGIKEALVDANQVRFDSVVGNNAWIEITPKKFTLIKAPLYFQSTFSRLSGQSYIECGVNTSCISLGDTNSGGVFANGNPNTYTNDVIDGLYFRPACGPTGCGPGGNFSPFTQFIWDVTPSLPTTIAAGGASTTLTIPTCPNGFWPLIPNQVLWLNGTSGGLNTSPYAPTAPGPGEFVTPTGGTCTPGATNGTIIVAAATPGMATLSSHGTGYTLSNGVVPYIEDNAQGSLIENIHASNWSSLTGYGSIIQVDNDQGAYIFNPNDAGGTRCDQDFCGTFLFGPGNNSINPGIANVTGGTIQESCAIWYDGNDFSFGPTVCQAFNDYGMNMSIKRGGSLQRSAVHGVHFERGGLVNSLGSNLGAANIINNGYNLTVDGNGESTTNWPTFSVVGSPGGTTQNYYLSIMNTTDSTKTVPLPIGNANVNDPSANNVTVKWVTADAQAGKVLQFELYRVPTPTGSAGVVAYAPYPGVCDGVASDPKCLVATNIDPSVNCTSTGVCTFTDNVAPASLTAATILTSADGVGTGYYNPFMGFLPGGDVMLASGTYQGEVTCLVLTAPWLHVTSSAFNNRSRVSNCMSSGGASNTYLTAITQGDAGTAQMGLLLPDKNRLDGSWVGLKGRINFLARGNVANGTDIETYFDSQKEKTLATKLGFGDGATNTWGVPNRPQWDSGDSATCIDNNGSLCWRSPLTFHSYVNVLPNAGATNWTEEESATAHTFTQRIRQASVLFASLPSSPVNGDRIYCSDCTVTTPGSCTNITTAAACTCASGGTGAEAKRINGAWLCN